MKKYHPFRSMEEFVFQQFIDVLVDNDFIREATYEPKKFILAEGMKYSFIEKKKSKFQKKEKSLILGVSYTPDWEIKWNDKAKGIFIPMENEDWKLYPFHPGGWLDVKGAGGYTRSNSSVISYPIKMKWLYQLYGVYAQKVVPSELFQKTFFPLNTIDHYTFKRGKNKGKFKFKDKKTYEEFIGTKRETKNYSSIS